MTDSRTNDFQCASHNRKVWNIDKSLLDWHRFSCFFEEHPQLRWPFVMCLVVVVAGVMIIGIVSTALYLGKNYIRTSWVGNKEGINEMQVPAGVITLNESRKYDVGQKREDFVTPQNPADSTKCPDELHGCQGFDIRVSTSSGHNLVPMLSLQ